MEFGGNGLNMGLDRNFFSDGKGNHRISGIQSIQSKTGLIDSSSFVLKKRLARAEIGGEKHNMELARRRLPVASQGVPPAAPCGERAG